MTVPNIFTPDTTILSSQVNANLADFATEITNSLPRDGQVGMTGQLKAIDGGSDATPGITFSNEPNTGFRRSTTNTLDGIINSVRRLRITSTGIDVAGEISKNGVPLSSTPDAANVSYAAGGGISATNVQAAIAETYAEKAALIHNHDDRYYTQSQLTSGALDGRYYTQSQLQSGQLDFNVSGGRYYHFTTANALFLQGVRLGSQSSAQGAVDASVSAPAGNLLSGIVSANLGLTTIFFKPVQQNINGSWATVSG